MELKDELGAKLTNSNNTYTADSYSKYSDAYDAIVKSLDDATTVEALNKINIPTLKANAEAMLVNYVPPVEPPVDPPADPPVDPPVDPSPDLPEEPLPETYPIDETYTDISSEEDTDDNDPPDNTKIRCGSTLSISAIALVTAIGAALIFKKKD